MTNQLVALFFLLSFKLCAQPAATLTVELGVDSQKIFVTNATFKSDLNYPANTKTQLVQLLNAGFTTLDSLIKNNATQWCVRGSCYPLEEFTTDYLIFTEGEGTVEDIVDNYFDNLEDWVLSELFGDYLFDILQTNVFDGTPLTLIGQDFEDEDYEALTFTFPVKAPIELTKLDVLWLGKDTLRANTKHRILKGLDGQLFFEQQILNRLTDYYTNLSFEPTYFIEPNRIQILPPRISRFLVKTNQEKEVDRLAYLLLPHATYTAFLKIPKDSIKIESGNGEFIYQFNLLAQVQQKGDQLPILSSNNLGQYQAQLVRQGYNLNVLPTINNLLESIDINEQELYLDVFAKQFASNQDTTNIPPATPDVANGDRLGDNVTPDAFDATNEVAQKYEFITFNRNFIGLGVDLYFNDEIRLKTVFQRLLKDGSTFSLELAYAFNEMGFEEGGFIVSGSYAKDYLFFNALKKRLSLQVSTGSDFTANRVFANTPLKERRTGGKIRTEIDWYRNQNNQLFQSYWNIVNEKVSFEDFPDIAGGSNTIFSTEWGNLFYARSPIKLLTTRFKLENSLKFGWSTPQQATNSTFYTTGGIQMNLNQKLVKGMAIDLTAYTEWNSSKTPFLEQIGHQIARNRGFKQDAVIGRSLWGTTIEFWTPLPKFGNKNSKLNDYFSKHLRVAFFSDFSRYNKLLASNETNIELWSPGLGIRLLMGVAQVNFDWAIRQTKVKALDEGNQFSINLVLNSPFQ